MSLNCKRTRWLYAGVAILLILSACLYFLQHNHVLGGGAIALPKLGWLLSVLIFWYVLPVYWLSDGTYDKQTKGIIWLFLSSMLARAVIELYMMYVSKNWLHIYGVAHDIFSAILCLASAVHIFRKPASAYLPLASYFFFCTLLFIIETYFALYLRQVAHSDGSVFFLESSPEHTTVLWLTLVAVLLSSLVFIFLIKGTSSASASCRSPDA